MTGSGDTLTHQAHPERLNEVETTLLLESVSGARNTALLLVLGTDFGIFRPEDVDEIYQEAIATQEDPRTPKGEAIELNRYAHHQLDHSSSAVVTMVAEGQGNRWDPHTYGPTTFNLQRCRPFAAHVYRIAQKHDIAPTDLVGYRSPPRTEGGLEQTFSRLALYANLLQAARESTDPPDSRTWKVAELAETADLDVQVVHNHIDPMIRARILEPLYNGRRSSYPNYAIKQDSSLPSEEGLNTALVATGWNKNKRQLTKWLIEQIAIGQLTDLKVPTVWELINDHQLQSQFFSSTQPSRHRAAINEALEFLTGIEYVDAATSIATCRQMTGVRLTETGQDIIEDYITTVGKIIADDRQTIENGQRIALEISRDKHALGWLLVIDQVKGALAIRQSLNTKSRQLREVLSSGAMSSVEICETTGWKNRSAHKTLRALEEQGIVRSFTVGRLMHWELAPAVD